MTHNTDSHSQLGFCPPTHDALTLTTPPQLTGQTGGPRGMFISLFFVLTNLSYFLDLTSCHYHTLPKPYATAVSLCLQGGNRSISGQQCNNSSSWWQHHHAMPNATSHSTTTCEPQMQEQQTQEQQMAVMDNNWQGQCTRGRMNSGDNKWQGWWVTGMMNNRDDAWQGWWTMGTRQQPQPPTLTTNARQWGVFFSF